MPRMTDEEADALDELVTKNPPKVSGNGKNGCFMKHKGNIVILDDVSATWLRVTSEYTANPHSEPQPGQLGEGTRLVWLAVN